MANTFDTKGIVIASTHRREHKTTPDQAEWANRVLGDAYREDVKNLNRKLGGYPEDTHFMQSCMKETAYHYKPAKKYGSLDEFEKVRALFDAAEDSDDIINVLCWGSLTEPAILVNHCYHTGRLDILRKLRFIAHWTNSHFRQGTRTNPENVANCREDAAACAYLKMMALNGHIQYYECSAIGQHGIVSGSPKGREYFDQFRNSRLGTLFVEGKYVYDCVDHSDSATYWVLLGNWGVSLNDINSNGTNPPEVEQANEEQFRFWSKRIHDELLNRSNAAAGR